MTRNQFSRLEKSSVWVIAIVMSSMAIGQGNPTASMISDPFSTKNEGRQRVADLLKTMSKRKKSRPTQPSVLFRAFSLNGREIRNGEVGSILFTTDPKQINRMQKIAVDESLDFYGEQEQLLEAAVATGKPVVLVLINGRPLDVRRASDHVPDILEAWFPGAEGGPAIANLLYGAARPGGKLPFTWPRDAGQLPPYYAHNSTHAPGNQAKRYWNEDGRPLFPFGFGLSYSQFAFPISSSIERRFPGAKA